MVRRATLDRSAIMRAAHVAAKARMAPSYELSEMAARQPITVVGNQRTRDLLMQASSIRAAARRRPLEQSAN
jgi:hypothetical protein